MVRTALSLLAGSLFLLSCSEKQSVVHFDSTPVRDTTYLGTVESVSQRRVLIEEFTGVKCPNCPVGHTVLSNFAAQYPGRISIIGYQVFGNDQTKPIEGETRNDNRNQKATDISSSVFGGVPALPVASFDRVPISGAMLNNRTVWANGLNTRLAAASPVNLAVTPSYDQATRQVTVKVRVAYTAEMTGKQRLTLALTESGIVDAQESTDTVYAEYDHEHVFRDFLTTGDGDAMLDSLTIKTPGRVYERTFVFLLNNAWNPEHCYLVAFVHHADANSKEIYQAAEVKLR